MLFHVTWEFIDMTEDSERRHRRGLRAVAAARRSRLPGLLQRADYSGGMAILEVDSPATLARTMAPWLPWLRFTATPIEPVEPTIAMRAEAIAFRDSVG